MSNVLDQHQFSELLLNRVQNGQRELASAMRILCQRAMPELEATISELSDELMLEPLLFTYFTERGSELGLPQILFGALAPDQRPDLIEVHTDAAGRAYVPKLGYFLTEVRSQTVLLAWERKTDRYSLRDNGCDIPHRFEPLLSIANTAIDVLKYTNPLIATRFVNTNFEHVVPEIDDHAPGKLRHIERALTLLAAHCPEYYAVLQGVTRQLVVFRCPRVNSFATINAHGSAFFNVRDSDDEVFFFDELVHQCGHIIFNAMTVRRSDFLAIDADGPLNAIAPREHEARTIYDAFHGLYTEHVMSSCLRTLDEKRVLRGRKSHELFGRLSFIARKFRVDLRNLSGKDIFTPLGQQVYDYFQRSYQELARSRPDLFMTDMRGQPYNFDYSLFAKNNLREPASRTISSPHLEREA